MVWPIAYLPQSACACQKPGEAAIDRPGGLALTEALLEFAAFPSGGIVLDIGCGCGASVALLLDHNQMAIGVDTDPQALAVARRIAGDAAYLRVSGDDLPIPDTSVDGILAECCLSLMPDRRRALAEWRRVLKPRGILALSDLYRRGGDAPDPEALPRAGLATLAALAADLADSGLDIVQFADCSPVLAPWMAAGGDGKGCLRALLASDETNPTEAAGGLGYCLAVARRPDDYGPHRSISA